MNKIFRIIVTLVLLCAFLLVGIGHVNAASCSLSVSTRGNIDTKEHSHYLRVYTSPSNINNVQISYNGSQQTLDVAGKSDSESYIDYYISTTFVLTHATSWTSGWSASLSGGCSGGGSGGGGGGSW